VQGADARKCDHSARARCRDPRVSADRRMGAVLVVMGDVLADQAEQMPLAEHDEVVEQFAQPDCPSPGKAVLPRRPRRYGTAEASNSAAQPEFHASRFAFAALYIRKLLGEEGGSASAWAAPRTARRRHRTSSRDEDVHSRASMAPEARSGVGCPGSE
jgi:hypothetical protein